MRSAEQWAQLAIENAVSRMGMRQAIAEVDYTHPILDAAAFAAQPGIKALNGTRHTYFCGAHLRYGFHEDGLASGVRAAAALGAPW